MSSEPKPTATEIYRKYNAAIWRWARAHSLSEEDCSDFVQEVFKKVLKLLPTYKEQGMMWPWLVSICKLHLLQNYRTARRYQERLDRYEHTVCGHSGRHELDERLEAKRSVNAFLAELEEDELEFFLRHFVEKVPVIEIAAELGANVNTLYSRKSALHRRFLTFIHGSRHQGDSRP